MPWDCCGSELLDTVRECPVCEGTKARWTMKFRATRLFVIPRQKGAWVELGLIDALGLSLAGARYRVVGQAGDEHEGTLDDMAFARIDGISEGPCTISFPDLDGAEWDWEVSRQETPAGSAGEPPPEPAWVEVELRDADGRPVAGERYRLELPGGEVREGKLGKDGRAREEAPQAGTCKLTFPDLDESECRAGEPAAAATGGPAAKPAPAPKLVATG